ncbi:hypothetical protein [Variovorax terrae]|uniref:DUF4402 domain-containing protein n=1 Tax=Variovorax terrae TaxID=2923278 RepID=A0A9X1VWL9_9BURK|nr:hypothetical protein [Variovorax terrae]MCJ0764772.1 hypothetical protein [Variovorax terrae]
MTRRPALLTPRAGSWALAAALLAGAASPVAAADRLDDSASPRSRVPAQVVMSNEGRPLADSLNPVTATVKFGRVDYKLATARYVGRQARIYYVVPAQINGLRSPAGLRVDWRGYGLFASGSARPGERQLVWTGTVREAWMSDGLDLSFQLDLRELQRPRDGQFGFESYFEIEVSP